MPGPARGHAIRPHTADAVVEAWAPSPAGCYEEAVAAFVELFADTAGLQGGGADGFAVGPGSPPELLVLLLEEVLFRLDVRAAVPVATLVEVRGDHLVGTFRCVAAGEVELVGAVPKAVSYSGLAFEAEDGGWRCRATVDV